MTLCKDQWDALYQERLSPFTAARRMRCTTQIARRMLAAAAKRDDRRFRESLDATQIARAEIGYDGDISNWPRLFVQMADRIAREGVEGVPNEDRDRILRDLPAGITVSYE